ncbi:hypothetical protein Q8F55_001598 [Vanrija albida]|uniref:Histone chaperone domain-containing protein n=1 Tax=Vanrija albida TaxID=181172 RepID=A0ABR3QGI3_9TREE
MPDETKNTKSQSDSGNDESGRVDLDLEKPTFKPADKIELASTENAAEQAGDDDKDGDGDDN